MLVIDPDGCIDCGVCEGECPAEAILPDGMEEAQRWAALNAKYSRQWPVVTMRRKPPDDAEDFETEDGKFEKYFSPQPGKGD